MAPKVWYQLVEQSVAERNGIPFAGTDKAFVLSDDVDDIGDLRLKIRDRYRPPNSDLLAHVEESQLKIYANRAKYDAQQPLDPETLLKDLDEKGPLIVEVPVLKPAGQLKRSDEDEANPHIVERKRASLEGDIEDYSELNTEATTLMSAIRGCNKDEIFKIESESSLKLPFPSLLPAPNRFQLIEISEPESFEYQARSELEPLYNQVVNLWKRHRPYTVKVAGTIGYGKSHMLAVLVLLLLKERPIRSANGSVPFVCYIPDCKDLLAGEADVVTILRRNILLNMPNFTGSLRTIEDIGEVMQFQKVILVADQWNSVDYDGPKYEAAKKNLEKGLVVSPDVKIHGMSMNSKTWREQQNKQTTEIRNKYYGGFNDNEFAAWLKHHPIFTDHKDELARLTDKVPLLLFVFTDVYHDGDSWELVVQRAQQHGWVNDWFGLLSEFYKDIDENQVWKVFTLAVQMPADSKFVDFRFFYEDRGGIRATSEIVLRLLYRVWSTKSADDALLARWPSLLKSSTSNRSVLGFDVEQIIKAQICHQGVVGKYPLPNGWTIKRVHFSPGDEKSTLERVINERKQGGKPWWFLLDPEIFNYAGVDMILVTDTALVGINVTIAATHSSLDPFFEEWRPIATSKKMEIKGLFVAPDSFKHQEKDVDTAFLRTVYNELWKAIQIKTNSLPIIQDYTCKCKTGCSSSQCGCRTRNKSCNPSCGCGGECRTTT